ncbi:MAG: dTDP-4-amino-4,6-dideoxygalactose transaminase [Myxococcales bacterium 68-20]|nr:dTDP-4-amino-4,6-dideoxygalactose transaminase [Myxococcales bacterium]OJY26118.1 MAG: dTDP-4-amino-4,6-dideoxygalactose transaminase [Myxococcales bacterium 68-20]
MIPFNRPALAGRELDYIKDALARSRVSGDGPYCRRSEALLREGLDTERVLLTTSCTHALEMSAMLLDLGPDDEVIVPSFTFVSTVNAYVLRGAKPVFADIRADTLNLDESRLDQLVTKRTKAIVPVHYAGVGCEMDAILDIATRAGASVVEDNAHGLFGTWRGKPLGTFGRLATQSFHETKNFSCGEGGALVVNDATLVERAEILREKGTNRSRFLRGQVDKYTWVDIGSSYVLSDVLGALLLAQLEAREAIQNRRRRVWERYAKELSAWAAARDVRLPLVPSHCEQTFHMFYLLLPNLERRTAFIEHLDARGVKAAFHYVPLHTSPMGRRFGGRAGDCPVTERVSDQLVRLPLYADLDEADQMKVIEAIHAFE